MIAAHNLIFSNPATGDTFGELPVTLPEDAAKVIAEMRGCFTEWSKKPLAERARILHEFQDLLIASADEITEVINRNTGKSRQDALAEVLMTVMVSGLYLRNAARWLKPKRVSSGVFVFKRITVERRPHGVVLVIAPWNYPFYLAMPPVLAALMAGNIVVLKPSEITPAVGSMMEKLFGRMPELGKYVRVVHGGAATSAALVEAAPDFIFLTGSPATGKAVLKSAAENLVPAACELGGNDAVILLEDADLDQAAAWIANGMSYNAGQSCIAPRRVYVTASRYEAFVEKMVEQVKRLEPGYSDEKDSPFALGPITDPRQVAIVNRQIQDALDKGARLLTGNQWEGMFYRPALLVDADHSMDILHEESFAPVLPVVKVRDEAEGVRLANDSRMGLSGSVWGNDLKRARRVAGQIEAGTVVLNDSLSQIAIPTLPFGGVKQSGFGRIHGEEGLLQFTRLFGVVSSKTPHPLDLAVVMRKPGHYTFGVGIMRFLYGRGLKEKLRGLREMMSKARK